VRRKSLGTEMRHAFATRFAVVVTCALSLCSVASADSPKVVPTPQQTQAEVTQAISTSTDELNPEATISGLELCKVKNTVCLIPGHMTELNLNWDIRSVHVGDEKLIAVTPEEGDNRKLLVQALGITSNDEEKRPRSPFTKTNFYVFGAQNQKDVYEVLIENYLPRNQPQNQPIKTDQPIKTNTSNIVEIHNKKTLSDSTNYECVNHTGCRLGAGLGGGEVPPQ
jgi:hypothetical protein